MFASINVLLYYLNNFFRKHMEAISYPKNDFEAPFEKKNLLKSQRIFKWDANLCSSEQQSVSKKSITAGKDNKSRKIIKDSQNQFIRIEENFKSGLPEIAGKHNWESNQLQNFESSFNSISKSNSLNIPLKLLPKSTSGSSLNRTDSSEGAWNFSPNSDLESDESLRSPQIKQWLGNFTNSSCPSPALTISSVESLTQWNNDDNNNQFPGGSKLIPSFNKCSVGTDYDSQRILNNSAKVLFPQVPNHNHYF